MMPDTFRAFFRAGVFVALLAALMVATVPRESAEFVVSVCSLGIGGTLMGLAALLTWVTTRR